MDNPRADGPIDVSRVMADIRIRASAELRDRTFDRGNTPEFSDAALFDLVEQVLRGAVDDADRKVLLLSEIIAGDKALTLEPSARMTSHRPVVGPLILFVKRRLLQPLTQWLYEYSMDNFRRQAQINRIMFAALQALAIENARLRLEVSAKNGSTRPPDGASRRRMKLCLRGPARYGLDVVGGSESHCRSIAERLAAHHDVTVLTSCASDYTFLEEHVPRGQRALSVR